MKKKAMKDRGVAGNHAALLERNRKIRSFGHDSDAAARFVAQKFSIPAHGRILEVGTGNGRFTMVLARRTEKVMSCDLDRAAQGRARLTLRWYGLEKKVRMVRADATRLPFRDRLFDAVISVNTLHHVRAPMRAVQEMARILRPGGLLVIADFNEKGFHAMERLHRSEGNMHPRSKFSMGRIQATLLRSGIKVRRFIGCNQDVLVSL
jgi:ubiquinone/menaquinone biosynthesis C-methylase UbiE